MRVLTFLSFVSLIAIASACGPNAVQKKLIEQITIVQKSLEDNLTALEANSEYLVKEQAEFEATGKTLRKKLGKADSLYSVLLKAHGKVAEGLKEKTDKLKSINDEYKSFVEKLNAPVSFTFDVREIEKDYALLKTEQEKLSEEAKPAMSEHERLEEQMKARLLEIETSLASVNSPVSNAASAKSSAPKKTKP
ncbi:MAG: hypothetical protein SFU91_10350 [Chloroherpetonaceae bacterium]|nr:hypothetical protein [Chloroherpetonaceae bacterium]